MAKVTQPMLTMSFKDVKDRITILETSRTIAEENRLMGEHDILRARVMAAEQELIKYLERIKLNENFALIICNSLRH